MQSLAAARGGTCGVGARSRKARRCIAVNETTSVGRGHGEGVGRRTIAAQEHSTGCRTRAETEAAGGAEEARIRAERLDGPSQTAKAWAIAGRTDAPERRRGARRPYGLTEGRARPSDPRREHDAGQTARSVLKTLGKARFVR